MRLLSKWKSMMTKLVLVTIGYLLPLMSIPRGTGRHGGTLPCSHTHLAGDKRHAPPMTSQNDVMIGVMTTRHYLATRVSAIHSTWGKDVPSLVFYVGMATSDNATRTAELFEDPTSTPEPVRTVNNLRVVELRGVNDVTYPPRAKSFAMLRHMYRAFGRHFRWFVRADDDVYIRYEALVKFLNSLDPSRPWYIGQPSIGKAEERGRLGLRAGHPYCMGGTGIVFSSPSLRLLIPHLVECGATTKTSHEDTELGRCVLRHVNISCTTKSHMAKMHTLFHQVYSEGELKADMLRRDTGTLLTLHPLKDPHSMHFVHTKFKLQQLQRLQQRLQRLTTELAQLDRLTGVENEETNNKNVPRHPQPTTYTYSRQRDVRDFVRAKLGASQRESTATSLVVQWAGKLWGDNSLDSDTGEVTEGEIIVDDNPLWDWLVRKNHVYKDINKEFSNRKVVADKADQDLQAFMESQGLGNVTSQHQQLNKYQSFSLSRGLQHLVTLSYDQGSQSFLMTTRFKPLYWYEVNVHTNHDAVLRSLSGPHPEMTSPDSNDSDLQASLNAYRHGNRVTSTWPDLNILVTLLGRQLAYVRFLDHLTSAASGYAGRVHVRVGLYANTSGDYQQVLRFSDSYRRLNITLVKMEGVFSRAGSLAALAAPFSPESLLIFMDVDLVLTQRFLYRAASNVGSGRAYFPVCFSQFSPFTVCYGRPNCTVGLFDFSPEAGSWRVFGFGLLAITGGDLKKAGGTNTEMVGWGGEDVDFYERCKKAKIDILRAPDTGLLHEYHEQGCGLALSPPQKEACSNSRRALYGYAPQLTKILNDIEMTINDTRRADLFVH